MIQFTEQEILHLQEKGKRQPQAIWNLKKATKEIMADPIRVPTTGIANWTLYYYCPNCSVSLSYDRNDGFHHRCPSCGQVFSGEPYDSAWWGITNNKNYTAAFQMGLISRITGEMEYARKAIDIMAEYARYYNGYEVH